MTGKARFAGPSGTRQKSLLVFAAIGFDERAKAGVQRVPRDTSLYLDFTIVEDAADEAQRLLTASLETVPVASLLVRGDDTTNTRRLIAAMQKRGVAVLWNGAAGLATDLGCDGIHLAWSEDIVQKYKDGKRKAPPGAIIGADAGRSRHDAMELGEAGADYVAFGIPPHVGDRARAAERQLDLIGWWSELFEVPCVAFDVVDPASAAALSEAGADFIGVPLTSQMEAGEVCSLLRAFGEAIGRHERTQ